MSRLAENHIAVVVLNYNNYDDTRECLDGIIGHDWMDIVVVDNASTDGSGLQLCRRYESDIYYIQAEENAGYAAGNNLGIKFAIKQLAADYVCILNNDTLPSPDLFLKLARRLDECPSCAFVGPVLLEDGLENVIQSAGADINLSKGDVPIRHSGEKYEMAEATESCGYIGGACMMFRSRDFENVGPIPESYFLFFEETEWCLRATRAGRRILCDWSCCLTHKGSATISKHYGLGSYFNMRSRALFVRRNGSPLQIFAFTVHWYTHIFARRLFRGQNCLWEAAAIADGLFGRVNREFSHLKIHE